MSERFELPRYVLDRFTLSLDGITTRGAVAISKMLVGVDWNDVTAARAAIELAFEEICFMGTGEAALLAAEFYDTVREGTIGMRFDAQPYPSHNPEATNEALRGIVEDAVKGKPEKIPEKLVQRLSYEISRAAGETVIQNAMADPTKPRFARVAVGDTCNFCLALAGLGFQYRSKEAANLNGHYHAKCDCRVVPMWGEGSIEGYDPSVPRAKFYQNIDDQARRAVERAEKKGLKTTFEEERKKAYRPYSTAARKLRRINAKNRDN